MNHFSRGEGRIGRGGLSCGSYPYCNHCCRPGHTRETYWDLHGRPPRAHVIRSDNCLSMPSLDVNREKPQSSTVTLSREEYTRLLKC